ncbi:MAG TPA: LCP family protein [Coriobacteriia bacterium]
MYDETPRPKRSQRRKPSASNRRAPRDISRLDPATASDETIRQTNRRRVRAGKVINPAATRRRRRRLAVTIAVIVALVLVGVAVAGVFYVRSIGNKINAVSNSDPELAKLLQDGQAAPPGDPFYMVLMGSDARPGETSARSDSLMVARIDPKNKKIQMISIPRDSRVNIPGYGIQKINAAAAWGGPTLVIKTIKELTGLPISHFVNLNFNGFRDVVDAIGGVWIDVPQDIYDTQASAYGKAYATVKKGYQKLDGRHALTFVRTRHTLVDGDFGRMRNQQAFIKALASQALSLSNMFKASSIINAIASNLDTDLTPTQMADLVLQFKGMKSSEIDSANAPGGAKYMDGIAWVVLDQVKFDAMLGRMKKGEPLDPTKTTTTSGAATATSTVKPADFKTTVRNGAGVSGLGKQCSGFLVKQGFKVSETSNMTQYVYGRTLIVYQKGFEAQANFTRETLGFGDVIPAAGMYAFDTQVMVVIGKDWTDPAAQSARR